VTTESASIEGVERMDTVMVYPQQRVEFAQRNLYTIDVDRERNCYACEESRHIT